MEIKIKVTDAPEMVLLGVHLALGVRAGQRLYFHGNLGTGKTTLISGILRGLGHEGSVKSPTYTLVEIYSVPGLQIFHFDLYRLNDPEELEFLGIRDYLQGPGICLVEWPEQGRGVLPPPDIDVFIQSVDDGRMVQFVTHTESGAMLIRGLSDHP